MWQLLLLQHSGCLGTQLWCQWTQVGYQCVEPLQQPLLSCCLVLLTLHSLCTLDHLQVVGSTFQCACMLWNSLGLHYPIFNIYSPQVSSCCLCLSSSKTCQETVPQVCHLQVGSVIERKERKRERISTNCKGRYQSGCNWVGERGVLQKQEGAEHSEPHHPPALTAVIEKNKRTSHTSSTMEHLKQRTSPTSTTVDNNNSNNM